MWKGPRDCQRCGTLGFCVHAGPHKRVYSYLICDIPTCVIFFYIPKSTCKTGHSQFTKIATLFWTTVIIFFTLKNRKRPRNHNIRWHASFELSVNTQWRFIDDTRAPHNFGGIIEKKGCSLLLNSGKILTVGQWCSKWCLSPPVFPGSGRSFVSGFHWVNHHTRSLLDTEYVLFNFSSFLKLHSSGTLIFNCHMLVIRQLWIGA